MFYHNAKCHSKIVAVWMSLQGQGIVPDGEWDKFLEALRAPLPCTFRVTGYKSCVISIHTPLYLYLTCLLFKLQTLALYVRIHVKVVLQFPAVLGKHENCWRWSKAIISMTWWMFTLKTKRSTHRNVYLGNISSTYNVVNVFFMFQFQFLLKLVLNLRLKNIFVNKL